MCLTNVDLTDTKEHEGMRRGPQKHSDEVWSTFESYAGVGGYFKVKTKQPKCRTLFGLFCFGGHPVVLTFWLCAQKYTWQTQGTLQDDGN